MKTQRLVLATVVVAVVPALLSFGCNKKEDEPPAPSATPAAAPAPPPVTATAPAPPAAAQPATPAKIAQRSDAGVKDAATKAAALTIDAAGFPTIPAIPAIPPIATIAPSQLPGVASAVVGAVVGALPPGLVPPIGDR
ncbi:MAG TPA: hypothetical protein VJT73_08450 [Polyangiaceae bacterium]|nr:hypothetical protein [Polyangiaceae bacterium]